MKDEALIAKAISGLFDAHEQFLVVGLTGRTGCGCSTVARILESKTFAELSLPEPPNPPVDHEQKKDRIVIDWLKEHWQPFSRICVSHVITAFALEEGFAAFAEGVAQVLVKQNLPAELRPLIEKASAEAKRSKDVIASPYNASPEDIAAAYEFYYRELPRAAEEVKRAMSAAEPSSHTKLFQALGDNVRKSGQAFSVTAAPENLFALPRRIKSIINLGREYNRLHGVMRNCFVIDAFRHPYEILFLRNKFSRFIVAAVTTDEESRQSRLREARNLRKNEIQDLDNKEYPGDSVADGYDGYISQNIQACVSVSDVFVSNIGKWSDAPDLGETTRSICRCVALMQHPGLITPTPVERCMQAAFAARLNSGCISRQVGAVITDGNYSIKAVGWNDAPRGQSPCLLRYTRDVVRRTGDSKGFSDYERSDEFVKELTKDKLVASNIDGFDGRHFTYCFRAVYQKMTGQKNQVHTRALHAEENAFLQIAKYGGQGIEKGYLFTTSSPCELCAKKAYQLGIRRIYYIDPYPGIARTHILGVGEDRPELRLFSGVIGRAYHDLFEPLMPYKDELNGLKPMLRSRADDRQELLPMQGAPEVRDRSGRRR